VAIVTAVYVHVHHAHCSHNSYVAIPYNFLLGTFLIIPFGTLCGVTLTFYNKSASWLSSLQTVIPSATMDQGQSQLIWSGQANGPDWIATP